MINNNYLIDTDALSNECNSGAFCDFLFIKNYPSLGFKSFKRKDKAMICLKNQKKLSRFNLAPKVLSGLCKIPYYFDQKVLKFWTPNNTHTGWGYISERANVIEDSFIFINRTKELNKIQNLVDNIWYKTKLKFWDCHCSNIGYIKRNRKKLLVCIDTGQESFHHYQNSWGHKNPGPKCYYCNRYSCRCT